jgi:hypothetical protein
LCWAARSRSLRFTVSSRLRIVMLATPSNSRWNQCNQSNHCSVPSQ